MVAIILSVALVSYLSLTMAVNHSQPISPSDYQTVAKQGFATNYFKTENFDKKYNKQNIQDVKDKGFTNLRLRCRADLDGLVMSTFLTNLEKVVDDCLEIGVVPIISWIHHDAEAHATEAHRTAYIKWWKDVATKLKDKDYRLSFNLFTELGIDHCGDSCESSLRENHTAYNDWTSAVVDEIRGTGGNNDKRIIILGSPLKTAKGLDETLPKKSIYEDDDYMMLEWHIYASGPNQEYKNNGDRGQKYWEGDGKTHGRDKVDEAIQYATDFTTTYGLQTYLGAWMPQDNDKGSLTEDEVIDFAKYFVQAIKPVPWSVNVLDVYYDTKESKWIKGDQTIKGQALDMRRVLNKIANNM